MADRAARFVAYTAADEPGLRLWRGHPGRVVDDGGPDGELVVSFVNGPSLAMSRASIEPIGFDTYLQRGDRLVGGLHPLAPRSIQGLNQPGHEWPEGRRPATTD